MKKIDLYKFIDKNNAAIRLTGVYHDGDAQAAVATDAQVMIVSKKDFNLNLAYQVIDKDGKPVDCGGRPWPKWRNLVPDIKELRQHANQFPVAQFLQAIQNAENFLKNAPAAFEDGTKISNARDRRVYILIKAEDDKGAVPIMLSYQKAKLIAALPMEGAEMYFHSNRQAIHYRNEGEGLAALLMPLAPYPEHTATQILDAGIKNVDHGKDDQFADYWLGGTVITAFGDGMGLYRTPEKPKPVRRGKIIEGEGELTAAVRNRPETELQAIEGLTTFFRRDVETQGCCSKFMAPHVYKLENGFYVDFGRMPDDNTKALPLLAPLDGKSVREIVTERNLTGARYNLYFQRACA